TSGTTRKRVTEPPQIPTSSRPPPGPREARPEDRLRAAESRDPSRTKTLCSMDPGYALWAFRDDGPRRTRLLQVALGDDPQRPKELAILDAKLRQLGFDRSFELRRSRLLAVLRGELKPPRLELRMGRGEIAPEQRIKAEPLRQGHQQSLSGYR